MSVLGAIAKAVKNTGKDLLLALLGGTGKNKVPKGQANEPIDTDALSKSTQVLGMIYKTMQRAREDQISQMEIAKNFDKTKESDEEDRNNELIKALTLKRKPKKKEPPKKEPPKEEKPKPTTKKDEGKGKPTEAKPTKTTEKPVEAKPVEKPTAEKVTPKETPKVPEKKVTEVKPEAPKAPEKAPTPAAPKPSATKAPGIGEKVAIGVAGGAAAAGAGVVIAALTEAGLSKKAQANILAQVKAESDFKPKSENLNYTKAEGIQNTFGKNRIPTLEFAQSLVSKPEELANHVYAKTDGNSEPGDGWKYRGRGFIQITGKNAYKALSKYLQMPELLSNPDLLNTPAIAAKSIPWFFLSYKGKKPEQLENITTVNKAVGFADKRLKSGEMESEHRAKLAEEYSKQPPASQASPAAPTTGTQIDQASKENKDMKKAADVKQQINVNNNSSTQNQSTTSQPAAADDYDDRNPHQKK